VLASTPLDAETRSTLDAMGPVKYIVAADALHHLYIGAHAVALCLTETSHANAWIGEFKTAYPDAKLIAPQDVIAKKEKEKLVFDGGVAISY
jgi:hypothetical protein